MIDVSGNAPMNIDLILVHGTGAGDDTIEGRKWWQTESAFMSALKTTLALQGIEIAKVDRILWSGENSEYARMEAAQHLAKVLAAKEHLDSQDTQASQNPYFIIGHSHGGSIIWGALHVLLREHGFRGSSQFLPYMKGWITLGTPFILTRLRVGLSLSYGLFAFIAGISQLAILFCLFAGLALGAADIFVILREVLVESERWKLEFGVLDLLQYPLVFLGVALLFMIPVAFSSPLASSYSLSLTRNVRKKEERVLRHSVVTRWLGLWCREDEAIAGLRASLSLKGPIALRLPFSISAIVGSKMFMGKYFAIYGRYPFRWTWNTVLAPVLDKFLWGFLKKSCHGVSLPKLGVAAIGPQPLASMDTPPELPDDIRLRILETADEGLKEAATRLRGLLALQSYDNVWKVLEHVQLQGAELVHCSYYSDQGVIRLLCRFVERRLHSVGGGQVGEDPFECEWLDLWEEYTMDHGVRN